MVTFYVATFPWWEGLGLFLGTKRQYGRAEEFKAGEETWVEITGMNWPSDT